MSISVDDVLKALCSDVSLSLSNEHQKVYSLLTPLEAKLAFEVLVVYGLDVKVYHTADKPSKLYVTHPTFSAAQADKVFAGALAYATALKQIKKSLETLCAENVDSLSQVDYNIAFLKGQAQAKQILIQIMPSEDAQALVSGDDETPSVAVSSSPAAVAATSTSAQASRKYVAKPKTHYEELSSGPAVGRGNYPGKLSAEGEAQGRSVRRRMGLMVFGNMTTSSFAAFIFSIIAGILLSVFVMLKGFACPDLAVANKNKAWYCGNNDAPPPKQQQQITTPR